MLRTIATLLLLKKFIATIMFSMFIKKSIDEPLFSIKRIAGALRQWFYLTVIEEMDVQSILCFIRYHQRPYASHRDKMY